MRALKKIRYSRIIYILVALYFLPEVVFWLSELFGGEKSTSRNVTLQNFAFWPGLLKDWIPNYPVQPYSMIFTYGFLHTGIWHLTFNAITLMSLGQALIDDAGTKRFSFVYFSGLFSGAMAYTLLSSNIHPMVGASGALFAIAGALLWQKVFEDDEMRTVSAIAYALIIPIIWLTALNAVMYIALDGRLAWEAHLGGFIGGAIAMLSTFKKPAKGK